MNILPTTIIIMLIPCLSFASTLSDSKVYHYHSLSNMDSSIVVTKKDNMPVVLFGTGDHLKQIGSCENDSEYICLRMPINVSFPKNITRYIPKVKDARQLAWKHNNYYFYLIPPDVYSLSTPPDKLFLRKYSVWGQVVEAYKVRVLNKPCNGNCFYPESGYIGDFLWSMKNGLIAFTAIFEPKCIINDNCKSVSVEYWSVDECGFGASETCDKSYNNAHHTDSGPHPIMNTPQPNQNEVYNGQKKALQLL